MEIYLMGTENFTLCTEMLKWPPTFVTAYAFRLSNALTLFHLISLSLLSVPLKNIH